MGQKIMVDQSKSLGFIGFIYRMDGRVVPEVIVLGSADPLGWDRSVDGEFPGTYCIGVRCQSGVSPFVSSLWLRPGLLNDKSFNFTQQSRWGTAPDRGNVLGLILHILQ